MFYIEESQIEDSKKENETKRTYENNCYEYIKYCDRWIRQSLFGSKEGEILMNRTQSINIKILQQNIRRYNAKIFSKFYLKSANQKLGTSQNYRQRANKYFQEKYSVSSQNEKIENISPYVKPARKVFLLLADFFHFKLDQPIYGQEKVNSIALSSIQPLFQILKEIEKYEGFKQEPINENLKGKMSLQLKKFRLNAALIHQSYKVKKRNETGELDKRREPQLTSTNLQITLEIALLDKLSQKLFMIEDQPIQSKQQLEEQSQFFQQINIIQIENDHSARQKRLNNLQIIRQKIEKQKNLNYVKKVLSQLQQYDKNKIFIFHSDYRCEGLLQNRNN